MNKDQVFVEVINVIINVLGKTTQVQSITLETTIPYLNFDSLELIEVTIELEEVFAINIDDATTASWKLVDDIVNTCYNLILKQS